MARKSRKISSETASEQKEISYHTALYARLSKEDNGVDADSIENQIYLMKQYVKQFSELHPVDVFTDNGRTGTDFNRPGFLAMMEGVQTGTIRCIVVKDLSRFGRNYLETGNYLETVFPKFNVRFLSINDDYDSFRADYKDTLLVPLKTILHDAYARDISQKVSTAIDAKKKVGKFLGKIPPYGYVRDKKDRYRLCIHEERAVIVRQIFAWRLNGDGVSAIAKRLNERNIPTQRKLRWQEGYKDGKAEARWSASAVSAVLKNPCYLGCIVERKSSCLLYQGKKRTDIPPSEWRLIAHTHEAIIEEEIFRAVEHLGAGNTQKSK